MRSSLARICLVLLILQAWNPAFVGYGQTLADVARKEEERRKNVKDGGKVYTNKDLKPTAPPSAVPPPATDSSAGQSSEPAKPGVGSSGASQESQPTKDVEYWSGRQKALKDQLERDQVLADAMQTRINSLNTDFVNRDDPAQRAVLATDRQRAVEELARLKKAIEDG